MNLAAVGSTRGRTMGSDATAETERDRRRHALWSTLVALRGTDVSVWWDFSLSRWGASYQGRMLRMGVDRRIGESNVEAHARLTQAWLAEIAQCESSTG